MGGCIPRQVWSLEPFFLKGRVSLGKKESCHLDRDMWGDSEEGPKPLNSVECLLPGEAPVLPL